MRIADLLREALAGLSMRKGRTLWMVFGTIAGIGTLVAITGIQLTNGNRIVSRFNALTATEVIVEAKSSGASAGVQIAGPIPWDSEDRMNRLNGVLAAGTLSDIGDVSVRARALEDPTADDPVLSLKAASPGLFSAVHAKLKVGRLYDRGHSTRAERVVVLGPTAAQALELQRIDDATSIFVDDRLYLVVGILELDEKTTPRATALFDAVIIPDGTARSDYALTSPASVHIDTAVGATQLITRQAPTALNPARSDQLDARPTAGSPRRIREETQRDVNFLYVAIGGVVLLLALAFIVALSMTTVEERRGEIGLRRSLGATRLHIGAQFLLECTFIGAAGGLIGSSAGIVTTVAVAAARGDTPVLDPWLPPAAVIGGVVVGMVAGLYPAMRAARQEPVDALRSSAT